MLFIHVLLCDNIIDGFLETKDGENKNGLCIHVLLWDNINDGFRESKGT